MSADNDANRLHIDDLAGEDEFEEESAPLLSSNSTARVLGGSRRAVSRRNIELPKLGHRSAYIARAFFWRQIRHFGPCPFNLN